MGLMISRIDKHSERSFQVRTVKMFFPLALVCLSVSCHSQNVPTGKLVRAASRAHTNNVGSIQVPLPVIMQESMPSLDEKLRKYFAVVVEPISKVTTLDDGGNSISSWYKCKLLRSFSHTTLGPHEDEATLLAHLSNLPRQLLPIANDEVIVQFIGGKMSIDGVIVTYGPETAALALHTHYFLILGRFGFNDSTNSNIGFAPIGTWSSVFTVAPDGDSLVPLLPQSNSAVQGRVAEEFYGHLHEAARIAPERATR